VLAIAIVEKIKENLYLQQYFIGLKSGSFGIMGKNVFKITLSSILPPA